MSFETAPSISPTFDDLTAELAAEGEPFNPVFLDKIDDQPLFDALAQNATLDIKELLRHSLRYSVLAATDIYGDKQTIPQGPDNTDVNGVLRREESGQRIDLDRVRAAGVDPDQVLYFRVTQPSETPKPEYYWTSDLMEVRSGLRYELGDQASSAVILVSTLGAIDQNEGLMRDVFNDDSGIPVRQIGLAPFDQHDALATMDR